MTMTAKDNKSIARHFFDEIWNQRNLDVVDEYIAPDFIEHFPGMEGGREGFRRTAEHFLSAFPRLQLTIHDEVADGNLVVHRWTWRGLHGGELMGIPATNKEIEFDGMVMVRIEDGKIVERWSRIDEMSMLRQLGVLPPPPAQG